MRKLTMACLLASATCAAHGGVLLAEGFDDIGSLPGKGWVALNQSAPVGARSWFQGDVSVFSSQSGSADSYIGVNWQSSASGGILSNWLISPEFSTENGATVTFWLRGVRDIGLVDLVSIGSSSGGTAPSEFNLLPAFVVNDDGWLEYTLDISAQGAGATGRFAIKYTGLASNANYMGLDSFQVIDAAPGSGELPEPATLLLLGAGAASLALGRRRSSGSV